MNLQQLNTLTDTDAADAFQQCCAAPDWIAGMVAARPYADLTSLCATASEVWSAMDEANLLEAFSAHPQIGNVDSLRAKYAGTKTLAAGEQSSVQQADETVIEKLAAANHEYLQKFGFIFIVCATGKSAGDMLALLEARLHNNRAGELANAATEQLKITLLRLEKMLG